MEPLELAARRLSGHRACSAGFAYHSLRLFDSRGATETRHVLANFFPFYPSVSSTARSEQSRMVSDFSLFFCFALGHHPVLHVGCEDLRVPGADRGRSSLRSVRKP